jgi:hypothetical protein
LVKQALSRNLRLHLASLLHLPVLEVEALVSQLSHQASVSRLVPSVSPRHQPSVNLQLDLGNPLSANLLNQLLGNQRNQLLHLDSQQSQLQHLGSWHHQLLYSDSHRNQPRFLGSRHNHRRHSENQPLARLALANPQQEVPRILLQLLLQQRDLASHPLVSLLSLRQDLASLLNLRLHLANLHNRTLDLDSQVSLPLASVSLRNPTYSESHQSHPLFRRPQR